MTSADFVHIILRVAGGEKLSKHHARANVNVPMCAMQSKQAMREWIETLTW